jgi:lysylphosphatidylglycerol synthetase-like protein (DUF2156 family)
METRRWTNPSHPQTLQIAVFLLYAKAAFALLGLLLGAGLGPVGFLVVLAYTAGAFGVANDQNWGYILAIAVAALVVVLSLSLGINFRNIISLMFDVALLVLLIHPQSRTYRSIWFK